MSHFVTRSVNLPTELDADLRDLAFHRKISKGELMLELLEAAIEPLRADLEKERSNH